MTDVEFVNEVVAHAGLRTAEEAERTIAAGLLALGSCLSRSEAELLADQLPNELALPLRRSRFAPGMTLDALDQWVAKRQDVSLAFAHEHLVCVLQVLAEALPEAALDRARHALPPTIGTLLEPRLT